MTGACIIRPPVVVESAAELMIAGRRSRAKEVYPAARLCYILSPYLYWPTTHYMGVSMYWSTYWPCFLSLWLSASVSLSLSLSLPLPLRLCFFLVRVMGYFQNGMRFQTVFVHLSSSLYIHTAGHEEECRRFGSMPKRIREPNIDVWIACSVLFAWFPFKMYVLCWYLLTIQ